MDISKRKTSTEDGGADFLGCYKIPLDGSGEDA